ncbi:S-layer homology domain-containing protein [Paenibacillus sp. PAMC21692]|uniref:S-layer homology domain-containing protein n=1 Tax=Paenibacillus sp. PAMC21692 TaxID=2762320 RepID=UPI00164DD6DA|nr:S-layer homology domain-containing protein [Paenibacillus sp. PAMC21692]QNK57014.1 S-layer homology domain-containing protein [Paenibacillus sp. PAMC21692]
MRYQLAAGMALLLAVVFVLSPSSSYAANKPAFQLKMMEEKNGQILVTVQARNLADAFAFDLNVSFDSLRLKLVEAKSEIAGYTVPAIVKGNAIQLAHTMVGKVAGVSGNAELAVLTFERIRGGNAVVEWHEAKLVDSDLEMTVYPVLSKVVVAGNGKLAALSDIAGHWAEENIAEALELGFVNGYEDGTFRPQKQVTRAEFAAMLARALQLPASAAPKVEFDDHDKLQDWNRPHIYAAVEANLVNGYEDHTFRADQRITRTEMTVMLVRAKEANTTEVDKGTGHRFDDADQIPAWADAYVSAAFEASLMQGKGNNRFAPNEYTMRAEAVTAILNLLYSA